jgi:thiol:disulfide interchange protein
MPRKSSPSRGLVSQTTSHNRPPKQRSVRFWIPLLVGVILNIGPWALCFLTLVILNILGAHTILSKSRASSFTDGMIATAVGILVGTFSGYTRCVLDLNTAADEESVGRTHAREQT